MNKDEQIKSEILKSAEKLFKQWGFNKTTMEDIAHESGKGKSTLYYYYKSKEDIFNEVAVSGILKIMHKAKEAISNVQNAKEKLRAYLATVFVELHKEATMYNIITGEIKINRDLLTVLRKKYDMFEEEILREILSAGVEKKELKYMNEKQILTLSHIIMSLLRSLEIELFLENQDEERVDTVTKFLLNVL